jgi:tetratricopeptide (TPR) repeat protein
MVSLGDYAGAHDLMQILLTLGREVGDQDVIAFAHHELSIVALAKGAYSEAQAWSQQSIQAYEALGQKKDAGKAWAFSGYAARGLRAIPGAWQCLLRALRIATETQVIVLLQNAVSLAALLFSDGGNFQQALEFHTLAWRYPHVSKSRWFEDVCGRHIAAVAATLPPEMVAGAQERGEARDIWATAEDLLAEIKERS